MEFESMSLDHGIGQFNTYTHIWASICQVRSPPRFSNHSIAIYHQINRCNQTVWLFAYLELCCYVETLFVEWRDKYCFRAPISAINQKRLLSFRFVSRDFPIHYTLDFSKFESTRYLENHTVGHKYAFYWVHIILHTRWHTKTNNLFNLWIVCCNLYAAEPYPKKRR